VILVDANLLIYASTECPQFERAQVWLDGVLSRRERVGLPWPSLLAFIRIVTDYRLYATPLTMDEACWQIERWLAWSNVWIPQPTDRHAFYLRQTLAETSSDARLVSDAHLASLAFEHGLTLYTADVDFQRFKGLRWVNPIQ